MKGFTLLLISCFICTLFLPFTSQARPESSIQAWQSYHAVNKADKKPFQERRSHKKLRKKNKQRKVWY